MRRSTVPENAPDSIRRHLEDALDNADDPDARYDIRQSLQLLASLQTPSRVDIADDD